MKNPSNHFGPNHEVLRKREHLRQLGELAGAWRNARDPMGPWYRLLACY